MTRVLYVEDEALLAMSMEGVLLDEGFVVELAFDGVDGVEKAVRFDPDLIVTDYMMPKMDGFSMIEALRGKGIFAPVIVTTAVPEAKLTPAMRSQFDLYLGKPFSERDLLEALRRMNAYGNGN